MSAVSKPSARPSEDAHAALSPPARSRGATAAAAARSTKISDAERRQAGRDHRRPGQDGRPRPANAASRTDTNSAGTSPRSRTVNPKNRIGGQEQHQPPARGRCRSRRRRRRRNAVDGDQDAQHHEEPPEHQREEAGPHAQRGADLVGRRGDGEGQAEADEDRARQEVLACVVQFHDSVLTASGTGAGRPLVAGDRPTRLSGSAPRRRRHSSMIGCQRSIWLDSCSVSASGVASSADDGAAPRSASWSMTFWSSSATCSAVGELLDDAVRRLRRHVQAVPHADLEVGQARLLRGRQVGQASTRSGVVTA